jgi:twitching motility protein PilT
MDVTQNTVVGGQPATAQNVKTEELVQINDLLTLAIRQGASDIHLAEGSPIIFRLSGKLTKVEGIDKLSRAQMEHIVFGMMREEDRDLVYKNKDVDTSYEHIDGSMFRMNVFLKRGLLSAVFRLIKNDIKSYDQLNLPALCKKFLRQKQGLLMITGPTGSGKTTSLSAMIDWLNENFAYHIVTLEDPIEVVFQPKKSVFSQRELHADTCSMANALKSVLRQDPDVVVIAEMRDPETISAALDICETGHLVIGTLHTSGAEQTVSRITTGFPPAQQRQILNRLADSLIGVLSQRLVTKIGGGRVPLFEIFENTSGIANLIRSGETTQIKNAMTTGGEKGMFTMVKYANMLEEQGLIAKEDLDWLYKDDHGDEVEE